MVVSEGISWVLVEAVLAMVRAYQEPPEPEDDETLTEDELLPAGTPRK